MISKNYKTVWHNDINDDQLSNKADIISTLFFLGVEIKIYINWMKVKTDLVQAKTKKQKHQKALTLTRYLAIIQNRLIYSHKSAISVDLFK